MLQSIRGGCFETSKPTTHESPIFVEQGITHYCVTNMPGAVARTATFALMNATLPHIVALAGNGLQKLLGQNAGFKQGLNIYDSKIVNQTVVH